MNCPADPIAFVASVILEDFRPSGDPNSLKMIREGTVSSAGVELLLGREAKLLNSLRQVFGGELKIYVWGERPYLSSVKSLIYRETTPEKAISSKSAKL